MIPLIKNNTKQIQDICKKYRVTSLYLIGSAAREDKQFRDDSDIDFLLKYERDKEGLGVEEFDYFDLLFALENLLKKKVDLVIEESIRNDIFKQSINRYKQKIYES